MQDTGDNLTVLITGSDAGIGFEFAKQYAERGWRVLATTRQPAIGKDLTDLSAARKNVVVETLDVTNSAQIAALAQKYKNRPIDLLVNNAGILGQPADQVLGSFRQEMFQRIVTVNAFGALAVTEAFRDNVIASRTKKIVAISSAIALPSQQTTGRGGLYFLRASKAALNVTLRAIGAELRPQGVIVGLLVPGLVQTKLLTAAAGQNVPGAVAASVSVAGMMKVIDGLSLENSDKMISYTGEIIPW